MNTPTVRRRTWFSSTTLKSSRERIVGRHIFINLMKSSYIFMNLVALLESTTNYIKNINRTLFSLERQPVAAVKCVRTLRSTLWEFMGNQWNFVNLCRFCVVVLLFTVFIISCRVHEDSTNYNEGITCNNYRLVIQNLISYNIFLLLTFFLIELYFL